MTNLSPEARALLDEGKEGLSPSAATKAKILGAVEGSIASGSVGGGAGGTSAGKLLLMLVVAAGIGGGLWLYLGDSGGAAKVGPSQEFTLVDPTSTTESSEPEEAPKAPAEELEAAPTPALDPLPITEVEEARIAEENARIAKENARTADEQTRIAEERMIKARLADPVSKQNQHSNEADQAEASVDTLREEQKLISAAQAALRNKDYAQVHGILAKHKQQYPQGILAPERDAAGAIALCLDPTEESGPTEAQRFLKTHPSSPLAQRVKTSCSLR